MFRWVFSLLLVLFVSSAHAQTLGEDRMNDSDRGFLAGLLEDSLGGEGRVVRVEGFSGALSSTASIQRITIADTDGVWLDMRDLSMQWNRTALLRGRIEVAKLQAGAVTLARAPLASPDEDLTPEAGGFSLPNLPVSLDIQSVSIDALSLGDSILGRPARLSMLASASLIDGTAKAVLKADRTDGQIGVFTVDASYVDASQQVVLNIDLQEAADGIAANALNLRGRPAVALSVQGSGPITDFETRLDLQTDGVPRVVGTVRIQENSADALGFALDLSGDLIPLFPLDYAEFLGAQSTIMARGQRLADGGLDLSRFALTTGATDLQGAVVLSPDNWPVKIDITGQMAAPEGGALALPGSDEAMNVNRVGLSVRYDERISDAVSAQFDIVGLVGVGFAAQNLSLNADGTLSNAEARLAAFDGDVQFSAAGLDFADADLQAAAGSDLQGRVTLTYAIGAPFRLDDLTLSGAGFELAGDVSVNGLDAEFRTDLDVDLQAKDISRFSGLAGTALQGAVDVALNGFALAGGGFEMRITGQGDALAVGIDQADAILAGKTVIDIAAVRDGDGLRLPLLSIANEQIALTGTADLATGASSATFKASLEDATLIDPALKGPLTVQGDAQQTKDTWSVDVAGTGPFGALAEVSGAVTGPAPRLTFRASLPDVEPFVPQVSGAAELEGVLWQQNATWRVDTQVQGPYDLTAGLKGRITGDLAPDVQFEVALPEVSQVTTAVSGPIAATGRATMQRDGLRVTADIQGPYNTSAQVDGRVTGDNAPTMTFAAQLPDVQSIAPGFSGAASVTGDMRQTADGLQGQATINGPYRSAITVSGRLAEGAASMTFNASLPDVGPLGTGISGPLSATGTALQAGSAWELDTELTGPAQSRARVSGTVAGDRVDVTATGSAPLGLSEPFLKPRSLQGLARFDLQMRGAPGLGALTGTIETSGARFSAPNFRVALENIGARIAVQSGAATLSAEGQIATGGQVQASGRVNLTDGLQSALTAEFRAVRLVDPTLYNVQTSGRVTVNGPLAGGALIAGQINIDEAQIQVPSSPATGFSIIPQITHSKAPQRVRETLSRAGLEAAPAPSGSSGPAQVFGLDISVNAPAKMFVRGRGLDAELGGALRLTGDTGNVVSVGGFELIRGRLDVLGKRFDLDEGTVILQGQFDPFVRFVATTKTETGTASVIIDGPASKPNVQFESSPAGPEDEVLAQIFFGRSAAQLTPFQALQLASAVASLTGERRGLASELRLKFDLDDLDVTTDDDGAVGLQLGKYLSDNVYVDVLIGDRDDAGVSLNIDLNPSVTVRGTAKADGGGALGIFFEKDY